MQETVLVESSLLRVMTQRNNYEQFIKYIDFKRLLPTTALLLKDFEKYYSQFANQEHVNLNEFVTLFTQSWHRRDMDELDIEYYNNHVFPVLAQEEEKPATECLLALLRAKTTTQIAECAETHDVAKIKQLLEEYTEQEQKLSSSTDKDAYTIENVDFSVLDKAHGMPWFLPSLQQNLGSLVKGQFCVVSADFGVGKSAFVISQLVETIKFLQKTNDTRPILYFNSEGTEADVFARTFSNIYHTIYTEGFEQIVSNIKAVKDRFVSKHGNNRLLVFQIAQSSLASIKTKMEKYNPALVIIDICDTLAEVEDVQHLKKLYDSLRLLSGSFCPIIGTTQAGDTSYFDQKDGAVKTQKWLKGNKLYGSKSGKGGAASEIITIGKDDDNPKLRYISVAKKKRGKECNLTCEIIDEYSLYKELSW